MYSVSDVLGNFPEVNSNIINGTYYHDRLLRYIFEDGISENFMISQYSIDLVIFISFIKYINKDLNFELDDKTKDYIQYIFNNEDFIVRLENDDIENITSRPSSIKIKNMNSDEVFNNFRIYHMLENYFHQLFESFPIDIPFEEEELTFEDNKIFLHLKTIDVNIEVK